jgi:hypothetical protein
MDRVLGRLTRAAFRRGLGGEHWAWLTLALAIFVLRRARRSESAVIVSMPINAGERYLVTLSDPSGAAGDHPGY